MPKAHYFKRKFEKEQKDAKLKIVEKLLNEQRSYQKRKKVQVVYLNFENFYIKLKFKI